MRPNPRSRLRRAGPRRQQRVLAAGASAQENLLADAMLARARERADRAHHASKDNRVTPLVRVPSPGFESGERFSQVRVRLPESRPAAFGLG